MCGSRSKEEGVSLCVDARRCPFIYVIIKTTPSQNKQGRSMMHPSAVQGLLSRHERPQPQSPELQNREERKKMVGDLIDKD